MAKKKKKKELRIGLVGVGFMGSNHYRQHEALKGNRIVAVCDKNKKRRTGDWSDIGGNIDVGSGGPNMQGVASYAKPEQIIADEDVDVVDICLPTDLHAKYAVMALEAGKDVICEKPMARTSAEGKKMVAAAKKAKRLLFVGHCIRFWPEYEALKKLVDGKKYGKLLEATFTRLSPLPDWTDWLHINTRSGGAALDLHIHDADYVLHLLGKPDAVRAVSAGDRDNPDHIVTSYEYGKNGPAVVAEGGWMGKKTFPFGMQFRAHFEKADAIFGWGGAEGLEVHTKTGRVLTPKVAAGDGYSRELEYFSQCIRSRKQPTVVTPESSLQALKLIEAEVKAAKTGRRTPVR